MSEANLEKSGMSGRAEARVWFARGSGFVAGGLVVVAVTEGLVSAGGVLLLVFFALLIASALRPLVDRLRTALPIGRGPAILLVYFAFFVFVAVIGFLLVPLVIGQAGQFIGFLLLPLVIVQVGQLVDQLPAVTDRLQAWSQGLQPHELSTSVGAVITAAQGALTKVPTTAPGQVVNVGLGLAGAIFSVVTILALVFFWLTERQRLQRFALSFLPAERRGGVREGWNQVELRLGGWVRGQLVLMVALGVATGVAYTVLGLPSGPVLGVIAGLAEMIPLVGPALGVGPALLIAAAFRPDLLIVVAVVYVVIQLVESNVLVPLVMRNAPWRAARRTDRRSHRGGLGADAGPRCAGRPGCRQRRGCGDAEYREPDSGGAWSRGLTGPQCGRRNRPSVIQSRAEPIAPVTICASYRPCARRQRRQQ